MTNPKYRTFLMCRPTYFQVHYAINPWMESQQGKVNLKRAISQWETLFDAIQSAANIELIMPQPELPDLVFTANAGLVLDDKVIVSRFLYKERQKEEYWYRRWFTLHGYDLMPWLEDVPFEGAGDALFDLQEPVLWMGYGFRSSKQAVSELARLFDGDVIPLHLINPHFYHLDTCFCPLLDGYVMYYPGAFDRESLQRIHDIVPADKQIIVGAEDADQFVCNAVLISDAESQARLIVQKHSEELEQQLLALGYEVVTVNTSEFIKAGGSAKCLTLEL